MQAQAKRTEAKVKATISSAQSLTAVKTLLNAALGCITYIRDLLPQDNFTETDDLGHLTTSDDSMGLSHSGSTSTVSSPPGHASAKNGINGLKILTMSRGYTDEADRILNYLEYGIFDALQKQYLKSFIFAIYLDNKDPNNIVEAYTFNFQYHTLPGTDTVIPVMSLGDDLERLSLHGNEKDPVVEAAKRGTAPTLKDVKRSVKALLKRLITSMNQMDVLPSRRYATFKLFYTDDTPVEYEPPHFKPGDYERDKWYFATHNLDEVPDTWPLGKLNAGWHEVDLKISSISTHLPTSTENDSKTFGGIVDRAGLAEPPRLSPAEEMAQRAEDIKKQTIDAQNRRIVWAAEDVPYEDGTSVDNDHTSSSRPDFILKPIGMKDDDGIIHDLASMGVDESAGESHYSGVTPQIPRLHEIQNPISNVVDPDFPQTQPVSDSDADGSSYGGQPWNANGKQTPDLGRNRTTRRQVSDAFSLGDQSEMEIPTPCPTRKSRAAALPASSMSPPPSPFPTQRVVERVESVEMRAPEEEETANKLMKQLALSRDGVDDIENEDEEMLDLETQIVDAIDPSVKSPDQDPIESFESEKSPPPPRTQGRTDVTEAPISPIAPSPAPAQPPKRRKENDDVVECECGINVMQDLPHLSSFKNQTSAVLAKSVKSGIISAGHSLGEWGPDSGRCMGYHSTDDPRLPDDFVCFDCRVRADPSWELIKVELYSSLIAKFRELASFRRAIKIAEKCCPLTAVEFARVMKCDNTQARQLIKRLETEGFISEESTTTDELGFVQTRSKSVKGRGGKGKAKQAKTRRGLQKQKFVFNHQSTRTQEYRDYFDPSPEVESRLLGLPQTRASLKARTTKIAPRSPPPVADSFPFELFPQTQSVRTQSLTQDDMQSFLPSHPLQGVKRPAESQYPDASPRPRKKVKISIAGGVDLAE
ncbi:hypothetical protein GYMLUDRAFT_58517 [Collybiopsis luxurians FD-317 M1]|uniref:HORMA domain-containing protein n=1 Tax=Collybiopsis luxurians FD-317 M1 TaxID=944289 RepID=A0A0D0CGU3_9AGAR|nr:hypothetical protein GYMLUDRAFT_58517 [Collybiopsis luxurians FD-317 M1]